MKAWSVPCFFRIMCIVGVCFASGCQQAPPRSLEPKVPVGTRLGVIDLRDCVGDYQSYCKESGENVASLAVSVLDDPPTLQAAILKRPVESKESFSDSEAAAYGKSEGYDYVVNGEVLDFHRAAILSMESQRLGITVRVLRTSDGAIVDAYSCENKYDNLTSLDSMIRMMIRDLRDSLEDKQQSGFTRFLLGRQNCDGS